MSLRGVIGTLAAIELARMVGNKLGDMINESIEAPHRALRECLDTEIKMIQEQSAATIRIKETENKELVQTLRQHFTETNKLYLQDADNFKIAAQVQVDSSNGAFEHIMSARKKLTQELVSASESARSMIEDSSKKAAGIQHNIDDRAFARKATRNYGDIGNQFDVYRKKTYSLIDAATILQSMAKDATQNKQADDAWGRAETYAKQTVEIAKQNGNVEQLRRAQMLLDDLDSKRLVGLKAQKTTLQETAKDMEERARKSDEHNAELERDRDTIQKKTIALVEEREWRITAQRQQRVCQRFS